MTNGNDAGGLKSALVGYVAASLIAHAIIVLAAIALYSAPQKKLFVTPAYTVVSIASPSTPLNPPLLRGDAKPALPGVPSSVPSAPSVIERPSAPPEKPVKPGKAAKETGRPLKADVGALNATIKKIERKVKKEKALDSERASVASAIESIRKKQKGTPGKGGATQTINSTGRQAPAPVAKAADQKAPSGPANTSLTQGNLSTRYPAYYALIRDRVQENWKYPFQDDKVLVTISMKIDKTGALLEVTLEKGSGNALLDASLINAVKKAAPFPALPHGFEGDFLETGLRFCQGCTE